MKTPVQAKSIETGYIANLKYVRIRVSKYVRIRVSKYVRMRMSVRDKERTVDFDLSCLLRQRESMGVSM